MFIILIPEIKATWCDALWLRWVALSILIEKPARFVILLYEPSAIIERFSHIPGGLCMDVVRIDVYISRCQLLPMKVSLYAAPGSIISRTLILRFRIMP